MPVYKKCDFSEGGCRNPAEWVWRAPHGDDWALCEVHYRILSNAMRNDVFERLEKEEQDDG